jgi:hypothetical protein
MLNVRSVDLILQYYVHVPYYFIEACRDVAIEHCSVKGQKGSQDKLFHPAKCCYASVPLAVAKY